ncbi:MAG TPA: hypothetical protein V6C97_08940 [Oculatellaceae cyanobacterium]
MSNLQQIDKADEFNLGLKRANVCSQFRAFVAWSTPFHIAILVLLSSYCFARTLGSYFIADDFPEIAYVSSIFNGHPDRFLSNFTGNYMQVPGMKVYRPGMFLTMVVDFLCYGGKAWGYFLTNLLYFTGDVLLLYFLSRALTANWPIFNSALFALFSAALFAVNPLHCETISWMCGRGDPVSAFFYLLSMLLFVQALAKPSKLRLHTLTFSVVVFAIALSIKEMPVAMPVVATVLAFSWIDSSSIRVRAANAVRFSSPFWITVGIYFLIRYLCLGTLSGGYVGGIGAQQLSAMFRHWTDMDTLHRMLLPVTQELASQSVFSVAILSCLNLVGYSVASVRLLSKCCSWRWTLFMLSFFVSTAAPIFQLWGIGPNLEGGRFYFYLSLPLSMMLPLLLFHPTNDESTTISNPDAKFAINPGLFGGPLTMLSLLVMIGLVATLGRITSKTNMLWVHAGKEDRWLSQECQKLAEQTDKRKRILVLGIPDDFHGAHLILNKTMFDLMLRPPFVANDVSSRFLTTIPIMYGPEQYVNGSRFKELISDPSVIGPFLWLRDKKTFRKVDLDVSPTQDAKPMTVLNSYRFNFARKEHHSSDHFSIFLDNLNLDPLKIDAISFDLAATDLSDEPLKIYWNGDDTGLGETKDDYRAEKLLPKSDPRKLVTVRLGRYWRWYACGKIKSIEIVLPHAENYTLCNICFLPGSSIAPTLSLKAKDKYLTEDRSNTIELSMARPKGMSSSSMRLEIGKNNYFFDNFQGRDDDQEAVAFKIPLSADSNSFKMENANKYFAGPGYYQIRLRCLDQRGMPIGECSDPVTLIR